MRGEGSDKDLLVENFAAIGEVCFSNSLSSIGDDDKSMINSVVGIVGSSLFADDSGLGTSTGFGASGSGG
jgi:hypothetical protein